MSPVDIIKNWKFDIRSSIITVLFFPLLIFVLKTVLKHLKNWIAYLVEGLFFWLGRLFKRSLAWALTLRRYCKLQLAGQSKYLHIPSSLDISLDIDKAFVTLLLEKRGGEQVNFSHSDLLTAGPRLRVIGDPGSGKSSLVKRVFRDSCFEATRKPTSSRLPILIELKNLKVPSVTRSRDLGKWFYEYLRSEVEKFGVYQMADCFDAYSKTSGLLVLLDGLDEVSSSQYTKVQSAIISLSTKLHTLSDKNIIVLTMRTQFHQQVKDAFRDSFGVTMFLKSFTPSDIYEFLSRWPFAKDNEQHIARIYKELTDRITLRELCSNPLILSMYVAEDQAAGNIVAPESRTEFYLKVTEELIIKRRLQQTGQTIAHTKLKEQRQRILGKLAYQHLLDATEPANSLSWDKALNVVMEVTNCGIGEAETRFQELAKETGLISEERPRQTFRFIHLTFCEFLAAFEAVQGQINGWENLIEAHKRFRKDKDKFSQTRLSEVIPFACGLLPRIRKYAALEDLSEMCDRQLLARSFLETKLYDHPVWGEFNKAESDSLLNTPEKNWDRQWLTDLHLFNLVLRDAHQCAVHMTSKVETIEPSHLFRNLIDKQKGSLFTLLNAYASQDAAAAFRIAEVCQIDLAASFPDIIVNNCDQAPFYALVKERTFSAVANMKLWIPLLTEAALRSKVVANWMNNTPPIQQAKPLVESVRPRKRWDSSSLFKNSLYTQCLTISLNTTSSSCEATSLSNILKQFPPLTAYKAVSLLCTIFQCLLLLSTIAGIGLFFLLHII